MDDKIKIDLSVSDETTETKKIHKQIHGRIKKAAYAHRACRQRRLAFLTQGRLTFIFNSTIIIKEIQRSYDICTQRNF